MQCYKIMYTRIPTHYNPRQRAIVEAETPDDARKLVMRAIGDYGGIKNYVVEPATVWEEPAQIKGKILSLS